MLYALLFFIVLIFTSLPRRKSLLSVLARTKTPATISQDCRLAVYTEKSIAQFLHIMLLSPVFCLDFYIATAPKIFAIGSHTDKNSCRNSARLSACCLHGKINSTIFTYHALIPCFFVLFFTSLPRRKSLLSVLARTKTPAAISQDCRLVVPASPSTIIHC